MTDANVIKYFVKRAATPLKAEIDRLDQAYWQAAIYYRVLAVPLDFVNVNLISTEFETQILPTTFHLYLKTNLMTETSSEEEK